MVSASERDTARGPQADATEHVQGAAACTHHVAAGHSLQPKLLSSVSELREEIILNWKEINAFVFDTTTADFDCWEAINLVANHRRERVRSIPALVILASEETLNEKERWARRAFVGGVHSRGHAHRAFAGACTRVPCLIKTSNVHELWLHTRSRKELMLSFLACGSARSRTHAYVRTCRLVRNRAHTLSLFLLTGDF